MLRPNNKVSQCDAVPFSSTHYSNYYVQEEADDGVVMESSVPVKDVIFSRIFPHVRHLSSFAQVDFKTKSLLNNDVFQLTERVTSLLGWRGIYLQSSSLHVVRTVAVASWMINSLDGGGEGLAGSLYGVDEKEDSLCSFTTGSSKCPV